MKVADCSIFLDKTLRNFCSRAECLFGEWQVLVLAERSWWSVSNTWRQSSARYGGARPASDWNRNPASLKRIHRRSGNQCSWRNTSVMCSCRCVPVTRCAAGFCTDCNHRSNPLEMPYSSELQKFKRQEMKVHYTYSDQHRTSVAAKDQEFRLAICKVALNFQCIKNNY